MSTKDKIDIVVASDLTDIEKEGQFSELNSRGFIRAENTPDQWLLFINEAWQKLSIPMNETIALYLSKMLDEYIRDEALYYRLTSFNYGMYFLKPEEVDEDMLKDVADTSLMYTAFVPGRSNHRSQPRSLEYSAKMGEDFYKHLTFVNRNRNNWYSKAYGELAKSFGLAVMVLRSSNVPFGHVLAGANDVYFPDDKQAEYIARQRFMTKKVSTQIN